MDETLRQLKAHISQMSDAELLRVVGEERDEYRPEAVQFALRELSSRMAVSRDAAGSPPDSDDVDDRNSSDRRVETGLINDRQPCSSCGGRMRRGALFADREMTVYFEDTEEERFVEALVCGACGTMRLVVDLDTDVQE